MTGARSGRAFTGPTTGLTRFTPKRRKALKAHNAAVAVHNELRLRFGPTMPSDVLREVGDRVLAADGDRELKYPGGAIRLEVIAFNVAGELLRANKFSPSKDALALMRQAGPLSRGTTTPPRQPSHPIGVGSAPRRSHPSPPRSSRPPTPVKKGASGGD